MRSVIHDIASPTRSRKTIVNLLRIQVGLLAVQNKVIPLRPQIWCDIPPEHNEGENIAILLNLQIALVSVFYQVIEIMDDHSVKPLIGTFSRIL